MVYIYVYIYETSYKKYSVGATVTCLKDDGNFQNLLTKKDQEVSKKVYVKPI